MSNEANGWFSDNLQENVRLVKMEAKDIRFKKLVKGPEKVKVSFADGYPYLILGTASLEKLNEKISEPVKMNRFRPNIVLETRNAHEEDDWESIEIGGASFMVIKACARCPVVTVDQSSGEKSKEPLKTLATYRRKDNMVYFGANAISLDNTVINIGDKVMLPE